MFLGEFNRFTEAKKLPYQIVVIGHGEHLGREWLHLQQFSVEHNCYIAAHNVLFSDHPVGFSKPDYTHIPQDWEDLLNENYTVAT